MGYSKQKSEFSHERIYSLPKMLQKFRMSGIQTLSTYQSSIFHWLKHKSPTFYWQTEKLKPNLSLVTIKSRPNLSLVTRKVKSLIFHWNFLKPNSNLHWNFHKIKSNLSLVNRKNLTVQSFIWISRTNWHLYNKTSALLDFSEEKRSSPAKTKHPFSFLHALIMMFHASCVEFPPRWNITPYNQTCIHRISQNSIPIMRVQLDHQSSQWDLSKWVSTLHVFSLNIHSEPFVDYDIPQ